MTTTQSASTSAPIARIDVVSASRLGATASSVAAGKLTPTTARPALMPTLTASMPSCTIRGCLRTKARGWLTLKPLWLFCTGAARSWPEASM